MRPEDPTMTTDLSPTLARRKDPPPPESEAEAQLRQLILTRIDQLDELQRRITKANIAYWLIDA